MLPGRPSARKRLQSVTAAIAMYLAVTVLIDLSRSHVLHRQNPRPPSQSIINDSVFLAISFVTAMSITSLWRLPSDSIGVFDRRWYSHLLLGILAGCVSMVATVTLLVLTNHLQISEALLSRGQGIGFGVLWAVGFLLIGGFEEFLYRGFVMILLARGIGFWPAAILLSLSFAIGHRSNPGENWIGLLSVFVFGMLMCVAVRCTNSLWWPIGFHASWNWSQAYLFGTASSGTRIIGQLTKATPIGSAWLSGGSVGPEGSIFSIVIALLMFAPLLVFAKRERSEQAATHHRLMHDGTA